METTQSYLLVQFFICKNYVKKLISEDKSTRVYSLFLSINTNDF